MSTHQTAIVDPGAQIDPTCEIGPYAVIGPDVIMGPRCTVGAHSVLEYVHMGADNRMHPGCYVGTAPQDLKYAGEKTLLKMGDKNTVRECVTINRGTTASGETIIGSGCLFMAFSHVAHDCRLGDGVVIANAGTLAGHVEIGSCSVIGGLVAIHQFVRIGSYCMLGGGAMVAQDVLPFTNAQGDRANIRGLNLVGMRRAGLSREAVKSVKEAYKVLFLADHPWDEAVSRIKAIDTPQVKEWVRFIDISKRGLMKPAKLSAVEEGVAS
jgi:UDP-N-acetylglucosamine acyltransferase